ncbi:hypothetical protein U1Q18_031652 [Sarracenia purpurea var. burkii]
MGLSFGSGRDLVAGHWMWSDYWSPIAVFGLVIFQVSLTFTVLFERVPGYSCNLPLLPPDLAISPPENRDDNPSLEIFRSRLWTTGLLHRRGRGSLDLALPLSLFALLRCLFYGGGNQFPLLRRGDRRSSRF